MMITMKKSSISDDQQAVPMNYFWALMMVITVFMSQYSSAAVEGFQFVVGGNDWVVSPTESYNHWAERSRFSINDSLLFRYKAGQDSVLVVNREDYENCNTQHPIKSYTDGNSVFVFDRSGPFYFISGAPTHCYRGQKLIVVVLAEHHHLPPSPPHTTPPPTLSPPSITPTHAPSQPPTHVNPPSPTPTHVSQPPTHVHPPTPTPSHVSQPPTHVNPPSPTPIPSHVSQPPTHVNPPSPTPIPSHVSQPPTHVPSLPPTDQVHPPSPSTPSPGPSHVSQPPVYVHAPSPSSPSPKASSPPSSSLIPSAGSSGTVVTPPTPPSPGQPAGPATVAPTSNRPSSANSLVGSGCVSGVVVSGMVMLLSLAIVH